MQVPPPTNVMVAPLVPDDVQTPMVELLNVTVRPDVAVAAAVYVGPPTIAPTGAVEVKLMVWPPSRR